RAGSRQAAPPPTPPDKLRRHAEPDARDARISLRSSYAQLSLASRPRLQQPRAKGSLDSSGWEDLPHACLRGLASGDGRVVGRASSERGEMTRQASFKQKVRARMEKTGERYAAARQALLRQPRGGSSRTSWTTVPDYEFARGLEPDHALLASALAQAGVVDPASGEPFSETR